MWRYTSLLPQLSLDEPVSMGEGGTPLTQAVRLGRELGVPRLFLKDETRNPTGSFRDRAASLMVSDAWARGFKATVAASNGNIGASLAAYTAKAGLESHVVVPRRVDEGKLAQMMIYDADIEEHGEYVDDSLERAKEWAQETGWYQATPELNPLTVEGQKTIAYELVEQTQGRIDVVVAAVGGGSTVSALWKGFRELHELGLLERLPRLIGVQAEGCAPIVKAFHEDSKVEAAEGADSKALAILVKRPLMGALALEALKASEGSAVTVSDLEMFDAERQLARSEGVFVEPSSASTIACLPRLVKNGDISGDEHVVCLLTGSGLKAPGILAMLARRRRARLLRPQAGMKVRILELLSSEPTHGYGLWRSLGESITLQAVYQHLAALEKRGLIAGGAEAGRKVYRLTGRGKRLVAALSELDAL